MRPLTGLNRRELFFNDSRARKAAQLKKRETMARRLEPSRFSITGVQCASQALASLIFFVDPIERAHQ